MYHIFWKRHISWRDGKADFVKVRGLGFFGKKSWELLTREEKQNLVQMTTQDGTW